MAEQSLLTTEDTGSNLDLDISHLLYVLSTNVINKKSLLLGRGGGQVVRVLAFYSDCPSSNPADGYSFSVKMCF